MLSDMAQQIAVRLDEEDLAALDRAVAEGTYASRAAAVRAGVDRVLRDERDRRIAAAYRRAYGDAPQEAWVGQAGLEFMAEITRQEERAEHESRS